MFQAHGFMPIAFLIFGSVSIVVCYIIAVTSGHVVQPPYVPFISDTGVKAPESCLFTLFLTWIAIFVIILALGYYEYIKFIEQQSTLNKVTVAFGLMAGFGITLVASFQWTLVLWAHMIGALLGFLFGNIFTWLVVALNLRIVSLLQAPHTLPQWIIATRFIISSIITLSNIGMAVAATIGFRSTGDARKWPLTVAAIFEWLVVYFLFAFISTMAYEYSRVKSVWVKVECAA